MQIALGGDNIRMPHSLFYLVGVCDRTVQPVPEGVPQIVDAKLGPAVVIARCIESPLD